MVVTDEFREALRMWLFQKRGRQTELAKAIGCDPSNISQLVNRPDEYKTSTWVLPISEYTGIPLPSQPAAVTEEDLDLLNRHRCAVRVASEVWGSVTSCACSWSSRPEGPTSTRRCASW
jgi:hypothetical protein